MRNNKFLYSAEIRFCGIITINEIIIVENRIFLLRSIFLKEAITPIGIKNMRYGIEILRTCIPSLIMAF